MQRLKDKSLDLLQLPGVSRPFARFTRGRASIFMMHRFTDEELGVQGHDLRTVRSFLSFLRRNRYELLDLEEIFSRLLNEGPPLRKAVAFTIDDGYRDHVMVAAPLFAEFDCPVTTFATTGFVDGEYWFWWDHIRFVLSETRKSEVTVPLANRSLRLQLDSDTARAASAAAMVLACRRVTDAERGDAIESLAALTEVEVPEDPPTRYSAMTVDQMREAEAKGMRFGPHTRTHPSLSRVSGEQSGSEIRESWARLQEMVRNPVPIFCYPYGQTEDYGLREMASVKKSGMTGAVSGVWGYADASSARRGEGYRFEVPRFPFSDSLGTLIQSACGMEHVKNVVRSLF